MSNIIACLAKRKRTRERKPTTRQPRRTMIAPSESNISQTSQASHPATIVSIVASSNARTINADKGKQFEDKTRLPNIHAGLHLAEVAEEYGGCRMVFTLQGEDKHK